MSVEWKTRNAVVYSQLWRKVTIAADMVNGHTVALFTRSFSYWQFPCRWNVYLMPVTEKARRKIIENVTSGLRRQGISTELDERSFES